MDEAAELPVIKQVAKAGEQPQADVLDAGFHPVRQQKFTVGRHAGLPAVVQGDVLPPEVCRYAAHENNSGTKKRSAPGKDALHARKFWPVFTPDFRTINENGTSAGSFPRCGCPRGSCLSLWCSR